MSDDTLDNAIYDTVVMGTGLVESIVASQIAATTARVLHIDRNPYYGGTSACFSFSAFVDWATKHRDTRQTPFVKIRLGTPSNGQQPAPHCFTIDAIQKDIPDTTTSTRKPSAQSLLALIQRFRTDGSPATAATDCIPLLDRLLADDRRYSLELAPKLALCRGPMIDLLINEGIGDYVQFKGVEHNYVVRDTQLDRVPETKEDVFASTSLSLIEKRKLMRLLSVVADDDQCQRLLDEASVAGEEDFAMFLQNRFRLDGKLLDAVMYAVARVGYQQKASAVDGCGRVRKYIKAMGRYGRMAYLCAMYGGASELSQAFCRLCAVSGGTYILDVADVSVGKCTDSEGLYSVNMPGYGTVKTRSIVMDPAYDPNGTASETAAVSRAFGILDTAVLGDDTTALLCHVDDASKQTTSMLYMTSATMAVPRGQAIVYAWAEGRLCFDKQRQLQNALNSVCSNAVCLFTAFFEVNQIVCSDPEYLGTGIPDSTIGFDSAVEQALELSARLENKLRVI
ncbi:hypothetical protein GGF39_003330 [Coemansia sp. RSA 1721]|nr:hypothetical protein GGF39_003330 [Coemansia sp. RSA 1721]